ncbi:hypothetical protein K1X12_00705 [Hyphomonas sp. WL0036]|uniref:hypothetical protein n=1 Tax=Hyphomonas sediminis TaxID=2866160 RepID=UPI001C81358C|nr:hypothetical protein [Hyphomonas sediminis]MBY9065395.1 hypothetical protein [Hyphomonas sediminis]
MHCSVRIAGLVLVAMLGVGPALASPFDCGPNRIVKGAKAYNALGQSTVSDQAFGEHLAEIRLDAKRCPETGWVQIIAAGVELKWVKRLEAATPPGEGRKASHARYIARAIDHILAAQQDIPERLNHGGFNLTYDDWAGIVKEGTDALTSYAEAGHDVHPLVSDAPPTLSCNYVTRTMATGASAYNTIRRPSSLRLLSTLADACRGSAEFTDWNPLAQRAKAIMRQVEGGQITGQKDVHFYLREALRDVSQYLGEKEPPYGLWQKTDQANLDKLFEQHGVSRRLFDGAAFTEVPRADWFAPGQVGTEAATVSIALELSRHWTPLAAGVGNPPAEETAPARAAFRALVAVMTTEADAAGQGIAGRLMLNDALALFQSGDIRTPETADLPGMPNWLYELMLGVHANKIAELQGEAP